MKANRIVVALTGLTIGASAFAAGNNTVSMRDVRKALKASPVGLNLLHAVDAKTIGDNKIAGHRQTHIAYLKYQLTSKDRIQMSNRLTRDSSPNNAEVDYSYARLVLKYTRSGILTQDKHGVNLSANLEKRFYPDKDIRNEYNQYGLNRLSTSLSRSVGKFNFSGTAYVALRDRISKANKKTSTHYGYIVATQSYSLSDDWSLALTEELFQSYNWNADDLRGGQDSISMTVELGHQVTPAVYAGVSVAGKPFKPYDGQLIAESWEQDLGFGANVYWSAF
jgi:hypothetical protein